VLVGTYQRQKPVFVLWQTGIWVRVFEFLCNKKNLSNLFPHIPFEAIENYDAYLIARKR